MLPLWGLVILAVGQEHHRVSAQLSARRHLTTHLIKDGVGESSPQEVSIHGDNAVVTLTDPPLTMDTASKDPLDFMLAPLVSRRVCRVRFDPPRGRTPELEGILLKPGPLRQDIWLWMAGFGLVSGF